MPINEELVKRALENLTTAEDSSGAKEDSEVTPEVFDAPKPSISQPSSGDSAQVPVAPAQEQDQLQQLKQMMMSFLATQQQQQQPQEQPQESALPEEPTFAPHEQRQFARLGLDPKRLHFLKVLAGFRKGMNLEDELLDRALSGQRREFSDVEEMPLGQYA